LLTENSVSITLDLQLYPIGFIIVFNSYKSLFNFWCFYIFYDDNDDSDDPVG